jgi:hypothetical protein
MDLTEKYTIIAQRERMEKELQLAEADWQSAQLQVKLLYEHIETLRYQLGLPSLEDSDTFSADEFAEPEPE